MATKRQIIKHSDINNIDFCTSGPTFWKLLRKILGRFLILGKSYKNM